MFDGLTVYALAAQCALAVPPDIAASVALYESNGVAHAVKVNNRLTKTSSIESGIATAMAAQIAGQYVTFGLGMISTENAEQAGLGLKAGFSPCHNLKILADVLAQKHEQTSGTGDARWMQAAALFSTGTNEGEIANAYIADLKKIRTRFDEFSEQGRGPGEERPTTSVEAPIPAQLQSTNQPNAAGNAANSSWDVFNAKRGQSVLIFEGNKK